MLALASATIISWHILEKSKDHLGRAYAENFTLLRAQKLKEPVSRELALAQCLADSVVFIQSLVTCHLLNSFA